MRAIPPAIICGLSLILTPVSSFAQVGARQNTPAPAQQEAKPAQIDKSGLLILIRQTLTALDLSNKTGNYGILREISAPGFAVVNDSARLSRSFQSQRERNLDYSGVLAFEPQLTTGPEITKDGLLHFAGVFPSAVGQITFNMYFAAVNGQWKLFGLAADVGPAGPVAPVPQPQGSPAPATAKQPVAAKKQ
jgi:hypothetical protein